MVSLGILCPCLAGAPFGGNDVDGTRTRWSAVAGACRLGSFGWSGRGGGVRDEYEGGWF